MKELANGKIPKNAMKELKASVFGKKSNHNIAIYTPRAQAAIEAKYAKDNYLTLDSSTYNPDLFNSAIKVYAYNVPLAAGIAKIEDIKQVDNIVLLKGEEFFHPDSIKFIENTVQNKMGAQFLNRDAVAYFSLEHFDGTTDIKFAIIMSDGKFEKTLKREDILQLE